MNEFIKRYKELGYEYSEVKLRKSIRVNPLRISSKELVQRLKSRVQMEKISWLEDAYLVNSKLNLASMPEYLQGYFYIQEAASQYPARALGVKPGEIVLDMCSAPGGKATQMAAMMNNKGMLVCLDQRRDRIKALKNNLDRLFVSNAMVYNMDARYVKDLGLKFDKILLDAPCSGNFAADKDWFAKRDINGVKDNAKTQKELIEAGIDVLKKGGIMAYATCSLEPEEDELNVQWMLDNFDVEVVGSKAGNGLTSVFGEKLDDSIKGCRRFWPGETQGFFTALIRKRG